MHQIPTDVLFAISDTGGGHRSAAVALGAALDAVSGGTISHETVDFLKVTGVPLIRSAPTLYDHLSTRWLRFYDFTFQITNGVRRVDMLSRLIYPRARRNVARALQKYQPRLVVVTHPLVHRIVRAAQRVYRLPPFRIITVVTDLVTLHAAWTYPRVDLCLLPTDEAYDLMRRRGMKPERMVRTGFPVHPKFAEYDRSQAEARRELAVSEDRFTVLITGGGVGSGNVRQLVYDLEQAYPEKQLLVVTGKNRALYEDLTSNRRHSHSHIYGFVNNMEVLMAASDIVITKAGPGTLMEALVMRRPVIVTEAVGMQERGNIDFVLNHELGTFCPSLERIVAAVDELTDQRRYADIVSHLSDAVPCDGSTQIAHIILEQLAGIEEQPPVQRPRRRLPLPRVRNLGKALRFRCIGSSAKSIRRN